MESLKELQNWIHQLSKGEKRSITLLGQARAGNTPSQQLILFDWLNGADLEKDSLTNPALLTNLPTIIVRLKELILDGLRLLHKLENVDAQLRTSLDNAANLMQKGLHAPASRLLQQARARATSACRYAVALSCLQMERAILLAHSPADFPDQLRSLRNEELVCIQRLSDLQDLQYRYGLLRTKSKHLLGTRSSVELEEIRRLLADGFVERMRREGAYLENALAVNIMGIVSLFERNAVEALKGYQDLLKRWRDHPEWQIDQGPLLYNISVNHLNACATSPLPWEETKRYLDLLPDFAIFAPSIALEYQSTLNLNKFALAMNLGNLPLVESIVAETERWLRQKEAQLAPRLVLAFLNNMATSEFILGNLHNALRLVTKIVNLPNYQVREDIREFALVLRAVLLFELDDSSFSEHIARAGKRYFKKNSREFEFELAVFQFLEKAIRGSTNQPTPQELDKLLAELDRLSQSLPGTVPLLGLMEMQLWAKSKREMKPLREVFLDVVRANLENLG